jgi:hypothetical protein
MHILVNKEISGIRTLDAKNCDWGNPRCWKQNFKYQDQHHHHDEIVIVTQ